MKISKQPSPIQILVYKKQPESVEYFRCLGSMVTNDVRCTREIKSRITMAKSAFNEKRTLCASKLDLTLRKKLVKCYIWNIAFHGAETWDTSKSRQEIPGTFLCMVKEKRSFGPMMRGMKKFYLE